MRDEPDHDQPKIRHARLIQRFRDLMKADEVLARLRHLKIEHA
jgi:hypothetical protein